MKNTLNFLNNQKTKIQTATLSLFAWLTLATTAHADFDIGGPDAGPFAKIVAFVQDVINLIDGPVALAFSFISLAGLAITWAVAPKMVAAMGTALRVVIAVIVILNIGAWIVALQS